jgi:hypothetical protein
MALPSRNTELFLSKNIDFFTFSVSCISAIQESFEMKLQSKIDPLLAYCLRKFQLNRS